MALSRAAAKAARQAAKSRGLKGNRGEDGSLTTLEDVFGERGGREMRDAGYHDKESSMLMEEEIPLLDDIGLNRAWTEINQEIRELQELGAQMQARNWAGYNIEKYNTQMNQAKERLKLIEDEMDERGMIDYELGIYDSDVDEYFGRYT